MTYQKSQIELIKQRRSTRTYNSVDVDEETLQKLETFIKSISDKKAGARFSITKSKQADHNEAKKLGTYGVISGAKVFIIGIISSIETDALTFGYLFERIILKATDLGLQTCWLGGTFNKSDFKAVAHLSENESIVIISPLGFKSEKPKMIESLMRSMAGANQRKPWNEIFFDHAIDIGLDETAAGDYAIALEMVRIGPSASNKQPWRIIKDDTDFHFFICRTKGYGITTYDMQMNDLGIAKCHFELSAIELGLHGQWTKSNNINTPSGWEYVVTWKTT
jgi:nitroreductase